MDMHCGFSFVPVIFVISCSFSNRTPLYEAARYGRISVVQLLLSCNAAVDARNREYLPYHRMFMNIYC